MLYSITSAKEMVLTAGGSQVKINGSGVLITTGGKFESKVAQHVFNADIIKELKYTIINHDKKAQAEYQFDQSSSVRIYSDSADNIELNLIPGAYLKPIDNNFNEYEAELLDEVEMEGYYCTEEDEISEHNHTNKQIAWED